MTRLVFGSIATCRACHGSGEVRAPAMSTAEARQRARENRRRSAAHLDPLPAPPVMSPCPTCRGGGVVTPATADEVRA